MVSGTEALGHPHTCVLLRFRRALRRVRRTGIISGIVSLAGAVLMPCGIALLVALGFALGKAGGIAVVIGSFFRDGCIIAFLIGAALRHSRGKTRVIGSLFRNGSVVAPAVNARRRNDEQHDPEREPKGQHKAPGVFRHRRQPEPLPAFR